VNKDGQAYGLAGLFAVGEAACWDMHGFNRLGVFRTGDEIETAVADLKRLLREVSTMGLRSSSPGLNPELTYALRLPGMLKLALATAVGALARKESRGAHHRIDYPQRNDAEWLNRTLARWQPGADAPELSYEPVGLLDLPPGHRGYGASGYVDLPVTLEEYNQGVASAQAAQGCLETNEPIGARLRPGAWRGAFSAPS
jgi:fumarate reductase flavoprotein subunit